MIPETRRPWRAPLTRTEIRLFLAVLAVLITVWIVGMVVLLAAVRFGQ
jgi:hypothetical protein